MMISTRGRYALRVLVDLAEHSDRGLVPMKEIAERQGISLKYLEKIMPDLVAAGYLTGVHGKGGGYKLNKTPDECNVRDILNVTDGDIAPVACLLCDAEECQRSAECRTLPMWKGLDQVINKYLDSYTLYDLMCKDMDSLTEGYMYYI